MANTLQDGIGLLQQGDLDGAKEVFEGLLEADPKDASAHLWLGNRHVLEGDLKLAKASFRAAAAVEGCAPEIKEEALRQIRSLEYNRIMRFLVINPPLRWLLLFAFVSYMLGWGLRAAKITAAPWLEMVAVSGFLPLFFLWALFIVTFYLWNVAFGPQTQGGPARGPAKSARIAVWLSVAFVIPANLLTSYGLFVRILAIFLNGFVFSLALSWGLHKLGHILAGESPAPMFFRFGNSEASLELPDAEPPKVAAHSDDASSKPKSSSKKSKKKKKKVKK